MSARLRGGASRDRKCWPADAGRLRADAGPRRRRRRHAGLDHPRLSRACSGAPKVTGGRAGRIDQARQADPHRRGIPPPRPRRRRRRRPHHLVDRVGPARPGRRAHLHRGLGQLLPAEPRRAPLRRPRPLRRADHLPGRPRRHQPVLREQPRRQPGHRRGLAAAGHRQPAADPRPPPRQRRRRARGDEHRRQLRLELRRRRNVVHRPRDHLDDGLLRRRRRLRQPRRDRHLRDHGRVSSPDDTTLGHVFFQGGAGRHLHPRRRTVPTWGRAPTISSSATRRRSTAIARSSPSTTCETSPSASTAAAVTSTTPPTGRRRAFRASIPSWRAGRTACG